LFLFDLYQPIRTLAGGRHEYAQTETGESGCSEKEILVALRAGSPRFLQENVQLMLAPTNSPEFVEGPDTGQQRQVTRQRA